eukprot:TRINITY_DN5530_c0_g1_i1.p1 TRINITY_DN5530_c0_g1~~TRINITY_DN5530_c0_g1_i1.p1  ORF type:complete len:244 (-),score=37.45 TRINITY_DN5530_c0_g1_i1:30-761(-)
MSLQAAAPKAVLIYRAPLTSRFISLFGSMVSLSAVGVIGWYSPHLLLDNPETNPNSIEPWKRTAVGCGLLATAVAANVFWSSFAGRYCSSVYLMDNHLLIKSLGLLSKREKFGAEQILKTSKIDPKIEVHTVKRTYHFEENGDYKEGQLRRYLEKILFPKKTVLDVAKEDFRVRKLKKENKILKNILKNKFKNNQQNASNSPSSSSATTPNSSASTTQQRTPNTQSTPQQNTPNSSTSNQQTP